MAAARAYFWREITTPTGIIAGAIVIFVLLYKYRLLSGIGFSIGIPNYVSPIRGLRKLRGLSSAPDSPLPPLSGQPVVASPRLQARVPSGKVWLEGFIPLLMISAAIGFLYLYEDLIRDLLFGRRKWESEHVFFALWFGFMLAAAVTGIVGSVARYLRERRVSADPVVVLGRVLTQKPAFQGPSTMTYEFQSEFASVVIAKGEDSTKSLFERMPVRIVYSRSQPGVSFPVSGFRFFELTT